LHIVVYHLGKGELSVATLDNVSVFRRITTSAVSVSAFIVADRHLSSIRLLANNRRLYSHCIQWHLFTLVLHWRYTTGHGIRSSCLAYWPHC